MPSRNDLLKALLAGVVLLAPACALRPAPPDFVAAELAFARRAAETDTRQAFLDFLAPDAVVFNPRPVNGRQLWENAKSDPGLLSWYPVQAFVAASGDLGYDFGPFSYGARGKEPAAFGEFLSIWRRDPSGSWRVVADAGTSHPRAATEPPAATAAVPLTSGPRGGPTRPPRSTVADAEALLAARVGLEGYDAAVAALARDDGLRFHDGSEPAALRGAGVAAAPRSGPAHETVLGSASSKAGDLGYAWGIVDATDADAQPASARHYAFLHIWRPVHGEWRLAVDRLSRVP